MSVKEPILPENPQYILDGGYLLHRVPWETGKMWDDILTHYTQYVSRKFGQATVIFDGYTSSPSTKEGVHARRSKGKSGPIVQFTSNMPCTVRKDIFLSNKANKQKFITMLSTRLQQAGCTVLHATGDADVLTAQTAIASSYQYDTILVGDDTDLLILLCSQGKNTAFQLYFRPEAKLHSKKPSRCWDIKLLQQSLGKDVCDNILFIHGPLGCDTTSRLFGIGKSAAIKRVKINPTFREQAAVFRLPNALKEDIIKAGENALVDIYHGKPTETLDSMRLHLFHQKVSSSTAYVQRQSLPPTSAACQFHSLRVYHQVQQWYGNDLPPEDWGWMIHENTMFPVSTKLHPAPAYLLEAIKCNCKSGCNTRRCGCRKFGLNCSLACGECKGISCSNSSQVDIDADSDSDSDS